MKRFQRFLVPTTLILLVVLCYANSLFNGFVSDDIPGIIKLAPTLSWTSVFTTPKYLIRWMSIEQFFMYQLVGLAPWGYRLVNILCHAISVLLVYGIISRLISQNDQARASRIAFVASSLFAVHPIITESVTWISGGAYVQYGMLFLLSFWFYIRDGSKRNYDISFLIYTFSFFFSEKAGVLFLIFVVYEWCFENFRKNWKKLIPYFFISCIFILFYALRLGSRSIEVNMNSAGEGEWYNPFIQLPFAISSYFELAIWPKNLTLYHSSQSSLTNYIIRLIVFLGYFGSVIATAMKNRKLCFWLLWFLIPLLPTLTPLRIAWVVAERYTYLSSIALFVLIAYGFEIVFQHVGPATSVSRKRPHRRVWGIKFPFSRMAGGFKNPKRLTVVRYCGRWRDSLARVTHMYRFSTVFYLIIIVALIMRTTARNRDWRNEDTLWIATAKTSPLVPYTWNNMGDVYSRHGDYQKAAESFQRAISLNSNYADAYHNLGETYRNMGEIGDAILMYEKALSLNSSLWQSHQSLAAIYYYKKDYQTALLHIQKALKVVPDNTTLLQAKKEIEKLLTH